MTDIDLVEFRSQQTRQFDDDNDYKNLSSIKLIPGTAEQILGTFYENARIVKRFDCDQSSSSNNVSISQTVARIDSFQKSRKQQQQQQSKQSNSNSNNNFKQSNNNNLNNYQQQQPMQRETTNKPTMLSANFNENQRPMANQASNLIKTFQPNNNNSQVNGFKKPARVQGEKRAFQVIYGKYKPYKKNKEWSFDGFILSTFEYIILYQSSGKIKGRIELKGSQHPKVLESGTRVVIGGYECEVCDELSVAEFETGSYFAEDDGND